jgi:hypothetical protein
MQLLIGYLVALSVFLGGGYAGVQWLFAPDEPASLAEKSRPESASSRLINAKKIRDARALHRRQAEALAEGVKPAAASQATETVADSGPERTVNVAAPPDTRAAADASHDAVMPQVPAATVATNDPKLDARAEITPLVTPEKIKPVRNESDARQKPAGKTGADGIALRKSTETKAASVSEPSAGHSQAPANKKQAVSKKKRIERMASSSRKPVMMILRTIEFPDGRREQRLLPMAEARAGLTRYGSISAFADDDDF